MKKILHHIRKQPDHIKTRYVVVLAVVATVFVIAVWIITLQLINRSDDTIKTESPFLIFKDVFKSQVSDLKDNLPQKKESLDETLGTKPSDAPVDETQIQPTASDTPAQSSPDESNPPVQPVDPLPLPQPSSSN